MCAYKIVTLLVHLYNAVSSSMIQDKFGVSYKKAAWLSSINYAVVRVPMHAPRDAVHTVYHISIKYVWYHTVYSLHIAQR